MEYINNYLMLVNENSDSDFVWVWSLFLGFLITTSLVGYVYYKLRKQDPGVAPKGVLVLFEMYVNGFHNMLGNFTNGRLERTFPYLFTLFNYIFVLTLVPLVGLPAIPAKIMFTLTLAIISFIGIFVVGFMIQGFLGFLKFKYSNPLEIFSQIAPLISLSVRLAAATFASEFIGQIFNTVLSQISEGSWLSMWPLMSSFWSWGWSFVAIGLSLIQAYVFVVLTAVYWTQAFGKYSSKEERIKEQQEKKIKKKSKIS